MGKRKAVQSNNKKKTKKIKKTPSTDCINYWTLLPREIQAQILTYLPLLPDCFQVMTVSKEFSKVLLDLLAGKFDKLPFHLDFSNVNPRLMNFTNLINILKTCRGSKRITLHQMTVTFNIMEAISMTRVETLVISDSKVQEKTSGNSEYDENPVWLDLEETRIEHFPDDELAETIGDDVLLFKLSTPNTPSKRFRLLYQYFEFLENESDWFPSRHFQYLKKIIFIDMKFKGFLFKKNDNCIVEQSSIVPSTTDEIPHTDKYLANTDYPRYVFKFHHSDLESQEISLTLFEHTNEKYERESPEQLVPITTNPKDVNNFMNFLQKSQFPSNRNTLIDIAIKAGPPTIRVFLENHLISIRDNHKIVPEMDAITLIETLQKELQKETIKTTSGKIVQTKLGKRIAKLISAPLNQIYSFFKSVFFKKSWWGEW